MRASDQNSEQKHIVSKHYTYYLLLVIQLNFKATVSLHLKAFRTYRVYRLAQHPSASVMPLLESHNHAVTTHKALHFEQERATSRAAEAAIQASGGEINGRWFSYAHVIHLNEALEGCALEDGSDFWNPLG